MQFSMDYIGIHPTTELVWVGVVGLVLLIVLTFYWRMEIDRE